MASEEMYQPQEKYAALPQSIICSNNMVLRKVGTGHIVRENFKGVPDGWAWGGIAK